MEDLWTRILSNEIRPTKQHPHLQIVKGLGEENSGALSGEKF